MVGFVFGCYSAVAVAKEACGRVLGEEGEAAASDWWEGVSGWGCCGDRLVDLPFQCSIVGLVEVCWSGMVAVVILGYCEEREESDGKGNAI